MKIYDSITSVEKYTEIIQGVRERRAFTQGMGLPYRQEFYRGQLDATWSVVAGLARGLKTVDQLKDAETTVMDLFKQLIQNKQQTGKIFLH